MTLSAIPQPMVAAEVLGCGTCRFQAWYLDAALGQGTTNFTGVVAVSLLSGYNIVCAVSASEKSTWPGLLEPHRTGTARVDRTSVAVHPLERPRGARLGSG